MEKVGVGSRRQQRCLRSRLPPHRSRRLRYLNHDHDARPNDDDTKFPHTHTDTTYKSFGAATAHIAHGIISADISYVYNSRPPLHSCRRWCFFSLSLVYSGRRAVEDTAQTGSKKISSSSSTAAARLRPETLFLLAAGCHCPPPRLVNIIPTAEEILYL